MPEFIIYSRDRAGTKMEIVKKPSSIGEVMKTIGSTSLYVFVSLPKEQEVVFKGAALSLGYTNITYLSGLKVLPETLVGGFMYVTSNN